jgi:uncharacterized phage protein (TIGR02220 family)
MNELKGGRPFLIDSSNLKNLHARHTKHGLEDCLHIVKVKAHQWLDDDVMRKFFRPSTLFRPGHFAEYVVEEIDKPLPPRTQPELMQLFRLTCSECGTSWTRKFKHVGAWAGPLRMPRPSLAGFGEATVGTATACDHDDAEIVMELIEDET